MQVAPRRGPHGSRRDRKQWPRAGALRSRTGTRSRRAGSGVAPDHRGPCAPVRGRPPARAADRWWPRPVAPRAREAVGPAAAAPRGGGRLARRLAPARQPAPLAPVPARRDRGLATPAPGDRRAGSGARAAARTRSRGAGPLGARTAHDVAVAAHDARRPLRRRADVRHRPLRQPGQRRRRAARSAARGRLLLQRRRARARPARHAATSPRPSSAASCRAGRASTGSTSAASTCSGRSWSAGWTCAGEGLRRRRARQRRRLRQQQRLPADAPTTSSRYNRFLAARGARPRALDRAQERPRPGRRARAGLRLGAQRAVLPVRRVRRLQPFVRAGKAVFVAEYALDTARSARPRRRPA